MPMLTRQKRILGSSQPAERAWPRLKIVDMLIPIGVASKSIMANEEVSMSTSLLYHALHNGITRLQNTRVPSFTMAM